MEQKPRIFIGSSKENVKFAHAIHMFLNNQYAHTKLWETAVKASEYTLPALIKTFEEYDYGIFIFSEDDIVKIRKKNYQTVRDNVLFEFGLFIGKHGLENAFIIAPESYLKKGRIPSDLFGITIERFDSNRPQNELKDALSSSCLSILSKINSLNAQEENIKLQDVNPYYGICVHEAHMYTELVGMLSSARKKIIFVITNVERLIVFDLIMSLVNAKINKVSIDVYYYPQVQKDENSFSIEIFKQIGCNVKEYKVGIYPPYGIAFISDPFEDDNSRMILKTDTLHRKNVFAYIYKGAIHHQTIRSFVQNLDKIKNDNDKFIPDIKPITLIELQKAFMTIPLYKQNNCKITIREIDPKNTCPQSDNMVREFKLRQIDIFDNLYAKKKIKLYKPTAIILKNKKKHIITPPVLEEQNGKLLVAEGHSRLYKYRNAATKLTCVIVSGMKLPLLSTPTTWNKVTMAPDNICKMKTSNTTDLQRARKIESYLHKGTWHN